MRRRKSHNATWSGRGTRCNYACWCSALDETDLKFIMNGVGYTNTKGAGHVGDGIFAVKRGRHDVRS